MVDLDAWKKMAEFHARRGENVNVNPAKFMEVLSTFQLVLDGLQAVKALPHNPEASNLAAECLNQVGYS